MDFRASGVRSLKLNIFLILKEVKTHLILQYFWEEWKDVLKLQSEAKKRERSLKSTELKTKQFGLRGTKSASTKLKRQLKENDEKRKPRYSLVDTFSHSKNGTNHRTVDVMFMAWTLSSIQFGDAYHPVTYARRMKVKYGVALSNNVFL